MTILVDEVREELSVVTVPIIVPADDISTKVGFMVVETFVLVSLVVDILEVSLYDDDANIGWEVVLFLINNVLTSGEV